MSSSVHRTPLPVKLTTLIVCNVHIYQQLTFIIKCSFIHSCCHTYVKKQVGIKSNSHQPKTRRECQSVHHTAGGQYSPLFSFLLVYKRWPTSKSQNSRGCVAAVTLMCFVKTENDCFHYTGMTCVRSYWCGYRNIITDTEPIPAVSADTEYPMPASVSPYSTLVPKCLKDRSDLSAEMSSLKCRSVSSYRQVKCAIRLVVQWVDQQHGLVNPRVLLMLIN